MSNNKSKVTVNVNVPLDSHVTQVPARRRLCGPKMVIAIVVLAMLAYKFPVAALWVTTKLFGAVSATTSAAGHAAILVAEKTVEVAEQAKNAAEAELARRLIVNEALAALTPCSMLRCNAEMENIVQLLGSLKQAQHMAAMQTDSDLCSPIAPSDEAGRYLLATAAPWLIQQPQGRMPRAECKTTTASQGDTEETCTYETTLLPCSNAVKWPKLAPVLEEPLKIFNQNLAAQAAKQKDKLIRRLASSDQDGASSTGELTHLMEEVLGDSFVPAGPRRSAVRVTPYRGESEANTSEVKTILQKMEALREDQKIKPSTRFCKKDSSADSTANFCAVATKLTKEKLRKAIEVSEASKMLKLGQ